MELSDVFSDEPPAPNQGRAGGKFQPRAKQRPGKETSASVLSASAKVGTEESLKHNEASSCRVGFDAPASDVSVSDFRIWRKDVDFDQDPFEDVANTALKNVRAGGKFQPKAKPGPKKETSQPFLSALGDGTEGKATEATSSGLELDAAQVVQTVDVADDISNLGKLDSSQVVATDAPAALPHCDYSQFSTGKSVGEAADIFSELESLDPFLTQTSGVTNANAGEKSHDTIDMDALPANKFVTSDSVSNSRPVFPSPLETVTLVASSNNKMAGESEIPAKNFDNFPAPRISDVTEEVGAVPDVENDNNIVASGQRNGKLKPKLRSQRGKEKPSASASQHAADESVMHPSNVQFVPTATECMEEGSVPILPPDDVLDHSSMTLRDWMLLASRHEIPTNKELSSRNRASNNDAAPSVDVPRMPSQVSTKKGRKNAPTVSNLSQKSKKTATAANNDHEDEMYSGSLDDEAQPGSVTNDGEDVDGDRDHVESPSKRKRAPRRSKKPVIENEKTAQKHEKSNKASDQPAKEPPKKFSHSTRRKRCVDKALLETDDIDFQKIAIKDLILLAEHKEQLEKKEAKTSQVPTMNKSTQNSSHEEDAHNEESSFASEQAQESTDDQTGCTTQWNSLCLNYQSYMHKEPRARWSKQDTELFYQAIRQFGTDMSMIQLLFPGRTRHQIKLKFKNEEHRHPMRISEALASRAKDHSHFEMVIKQLQQVTAQARRGSDREDSIGVVGEEEAEELAPETNEETTKTKKDEDVELQDEAADAAEAHSPSKYEESEDDADMWDAYKNAF